MINIQETYSDRGFVILDSILDVDELLKIENYLESVEITKAGSRNLLTTSWCKELVAKLRRQHSIQELIPEGMVAIQCTYFEKSESRNWLVTLHRDYFVPMKERISSPRWKNWSSKEGVNFCRPPNEILNELVAIRIHLDTSDESNGPLKVVPGSHTTEETKGKAVSCHVSKGGALVLHPLLLHASSKAKKGKRRVLHFLFGPSKLPEKAEWANAV